MPLGRRLIACTLLLASVAVCALAGAQQPQPQPQPQHKPGEEEERILQAAKVATDNESLLNYLKARTLRDEDRARIEKLLQELDSPKYSTREKATKDLKEVGRPAIPFLKRALKNAPLEVVQRAEKCLKDIVAKTSAEPVAEVVRLLAIREAPGAAEILFNYLPHADESSLEEEVLSSIGKLTVHGGKVDPLLTAALKGSSAEKRAAAVYVIGQRGDPNLRELVRPLLSDEDDTIRTYAAAGLVGKNVLLQAEEGIQGDLTTLKAAQQAADGPSLVQYLQKRTLSEADQKRLRDLVENLGHKTWAVREKSAKALIAEGTPAVPFLLTATDDGDTERATRARLCIRSIDTKKSNVLTTSVVRLLALAGEPRKKGEERLPKGDPRDLKPAEAIQTLLAYVPFAEDDGVEEEITTALTLLSLREAKVHTALVAALDDPLPGRRAAAALVLGRVGTADNVAHVKKLLGDFSPKVQFRAAQGLVAAQDKAAVPVLIDLLTVASDSWLWKVDEQLARVAAGNAPTVPATDSLADYRKKSASAWAAWWQVNEAKVDLAGVNRGEAYLGLFTISEFDSNQGNRQGRVWECGRDGKQRWEVTGFGGCMDGQLLPNGKVLACENNFSRVVERDTKGAVTWTLQTPAPPIAVQRLPNGNTFVAMYDRFMEVTPNMQPVYTINKGPQLFFYGATRMKNGHIAGITAQGQIVVFDPVANKDIKTINLGQPNGWAGIDAMPNGHFLVSMQNFNQVREVDDTGKVHKTWNMPGVFRAIYLPNGNIVACSMTTRRVAELDRNGNEVWGVTAQGRPWNVRYR